MKKLISLLIAVLMVFGLLPVLSAPATHASADSSDGYGDSKSASHPADTLRGFSYFYHDSKFMGGPYGWVSMASGNPEGASFISDLRKAVTLPVNFTTATFTAIAMQRKAITTSAK